MSGRCCHGIAAPGAVKWLLELRTRCSASHRYPPSTQEFSSRPRLGIRFEMAQDGGARVLQVEKGSIAEAAGIRDSD